MSDSDTYPDIFVDPSIGDSFVMGIVGNIGSGKTYLTEQLIKLWKFKFDVIVWISPTYAMQSHKEIKDGQGIVVFDKFTVEILKYITDHQEARNAKRAAENPPRGKERMLLILDDNGAATRKLLKEGGAFDEVIIQCRHRQINIIQLAQRYMQLSPTLRSNAKFLLLFAESNPQERRNLYSYHGFNDRRSFLETIDKKTREKYNWIGVKCHPTPTQFFTAEDGYL
jgi:hypothetical protein